MTKKSHRQLNSILPSAMMIVFATSQFGCTPTTPSGTQSENSVATSDADQEFFNKDRDCTKFGSTYLHCRVNYPLAQVSVPTNNEFLKSLEIGAPIFLKYSLRCIRHLKYSPPLEQISVSSCLITQSEPIRRFHYGIRSNSQFLSKFLIKGTLPQKIVTLTFTELIPT